MHEGGAGWAAATLDGTFAVRAYATIERLVMLPPHYVRRRRHY
jgi:hypothetical protein